MARPPDSAGGTAGSNGEMSWRADRRSSRARKLRRVRPPSNINLSKGDKPGRGNRDGQPSPNAFVLLAGLRRGRSSPTAVGHGGGWKGRTDMRKALGLIA